MDGIAGDLLISNGHLFDPNFRHTVVLLAQHDEEGALGVVLNRPSDMAVAEAVPALAPAVPSGEPLFFGGPVQPSAAVVLADCGRPGLAAVPVMGSIGLLTGEVDDAVVGAIQRARVFAGYAGWGPGQLDEELARGDWIIEPARPEDVFSDEPGSLWSSVLRRKGGGHALLATMPFDPSTN